MGIVREAVRPMGRAPPLSVRVVSPLNKVIFRRVRIAAIATAAASTSTTAESAQRVWSGGGTDGDSIICQIVGQRERHFAEWSNGIYLA